MKNRKILSILIIMTLILGLLVFSLAGGALDLRGSRPENNPPGIAITAPEDGAEVNGTVTIWMNAWDADGSEDIDEVWVRIDGGDLINATYNRTDGEGQWWYYDWNTTLLSNGWHSITAVTFDGIDDASDVNEYNVNNAEGNNAPDIAIISPTGGSTVKDIVRIWMIAWDADGLEQIQDVWVRIDERNLTNATYNHTNGEGQWWYYDWNTTQETEGWHLFTAKVFDGTDDASDAKEYKVDNVQENKAPGVSIVEPKGGSELKGIVTIWMVAWDPDGNEQIQNVWVRINNGDLRNATYNHTNGEGQWWYYNWNTSEVEDGWHHVKAVTFDGQDDASDVKEYKVDNVQDNNAPGIAIVEPEGGAIVKGIVTIWMVAWDADGNEQIQNVWVRINNGDLRNATYNHTNGEGQWWYYNWNTSEVEDGWHHVKAVTFDGEDDGHDLIEIYVNNLDNHKPFVNISYPPDNNGKVNGTVKITGYAWDNDDGDKVELVQVAFNSAEGPWFNATDTSGNNTWWTWEYDWNTTEYENGSHAIVARSWDGDRYSDLVDAHVIVENPPEGPGDDEDDDDDNGGGSPGFETILIIAAVGVGAVMASFRRRHRRWQV